MKSLIIFGLLLSSALSFANTCHISLYDPSNSPYMNFYSQWDKDCEDAANRCYQAIRSQRLDPYKFKCYTISMSKHPSSPVSGPQDTPSTQMDSDSKRAIELGETVIYKGAYWIVSDNYRTNLFHLKPVGGKDKDIIQNIDRQELAVTRGCSQEICTKTAVIDLTSKEYMSVEGITYNGKYITKDIASGKLLLNIDFSMVARTDGCLVSGIQGICTGNTVISRDNLYYKVVGIQPNQRVVIESTDNSRKLYFNVDPNSLYITR